MPVTSGPGETCHEATSTRLDHGASPGPFHGFTRSPRGRFATGREWFARPCVSRPAMGATVPMPATPMRSKRALGSERRASDWAVRPQEAFQISRAELFSSKNEDRLGQRSVKCKADTGDAEEQGRGRRGAVLLHRTAGRCRRGAPRSSCDRRGNSRGRGCCTITARHQSFSPDRVFAPSRRPRQPP